VYKTHYIVADQLHYAVLERVLSFLPRRLYIHLGLLVCPSVNRSIVRSCRSIFTKFLWGMGLKARKR